MRAGAITDIAAGPFDPRSPQAAAIADLFTSALVICGAVFLLVTIVCLNLIGEQVRMRWSK